MPRQEPIDQAAEAARNFVFVGKANHGFSASRIWQALQFPALAAVHSVDVFKSPFEKTRLLERRYDRHMRKNAIRHPSRNAYLGARAKVRSAALRFKRAPHLRSVPMGHPLWNE